MTASASISSTSNRRVSDELGLWEPKRALTLEAARAHTQRIKVFRYVLMAVSLVLLLVLVWQFIADRGGVDFDNDPTESVKMVQPRYSGRTSDGLPFYLIADTATRRMSEPNTVVLDNPVLKFTREAGAASSSVIAKTGAYNDLDKILELTTNVNLETDDGNQCDTSHARIFNVEKRIEGDEPIICFGGFGRVKGQSFAIEDAYETFIFKDGMTAQLTQSGETTANADTSFGFSGDGPIDVTSDTGIYRGEKTDLRGNVVVVQDGAVITSDKMDIFRINAGGGSERGSLKLGAVSRIVATGDFRYKSAENDIRGSRGVYERDKNLMTVTGNVVVIQPNGNRVQTEKLTYNTKSGTIRSSGKCLGQNCDSSGRTQILIPGADN